MTIDAAIRSPGQGHRLAGTGKLADLIVLDRNLFAIPNDDISETRVLTTMVGGRVVFDR